MTQYLLTPNGRPIRLALDATIPGLYLAQAGLEAVTALLADTFSDEIDQQYGIAGKEANGLLFAAQALTDHISHLTVELEEGLQQSLRTGEISDPPGNSGTPHTSEPKEPPDGQGQEEGTK